jgi:hypothetical protein
VQDSTGAVILQTTPTLLYSNTLQLTVGSASTGLDNLFNDMNIGGVITYNTTIRTASFSYIDTDNTASQGCLYTYQLTLTNKVLYNTSCANSASSTITSPIINTSGSSWLFQGVVTKGGVRYLVSTLDKKFRDTFRDEERNRIGLFILFVIELIVIAIFRNNLRTMIIVVGIVPVLFSMVGLIPFDLGITVIVLVLSIAIAYIIGA